MSLLYRLLCWVVRLLARGGGERELEIVVLRARWRATANDSATRSELKCACARAVPIVFAVLMSESRSASGFVSLSGHLSESEGGSKGCQDPDSSSRVSERGSIWLLAASIKPWRFSTLRSARSRRSWKTRGTSVASSSRRAPD